MSKKIVFILVMIFTIFGILVSGTLTLAKYSNSLALLCGDDLDNSCNTVQNSDYSYLVNVESDSGYNFQIPIALAGVFFYLILLVMSIILYLKFLKGEDFGVLKYIFFGTGLSGFLFSVVYTWLQAFKIKAFCTYCLISAFDSVVLFILVSLITFKKCEVKNANKNSTYRKTKK